MKFEFELKLVYNEWFHVVIFLSTSITVQKKVGQLDNYCQVAINHHID